ncbi:MAG: DUF4350 domain-containing protein [Acidobacteriota bacterium]
MLRFLFWLGLALALAGLVWALMPTPGVDTSYAPRLRHPHFGRRGPVVLIDEAHGNTHTAPGLYGPLARLLGAAGYRVQRNRQPFLAASLETCSVLILANPSGFDAGELDAVRIWVRDGGGLLLIADRAPAIEPARLFARAFGVDISRSVLTPATGAAEPSGLLHPIRSGRLDFDETTQLLLLAPGPTLLPLDSSAREVIPSRAAAIESGRGRVVVLTDADALAARLIAGKPYGINTPNADNDQLALNILLWLSKRI